jgi:hypothetical protein
MDTLSATSETSFAGVAAQRPSVRCTWKQVVETDALDESPDE